MNTIKKTKDWFDCLSRTIASAKGKIEGKPSSLEQIFDATEKLLLSVRQENRSVWWVGNGGSAAVCSHLSQDMMNKLRIKSIYQGDTSLLTCMANDFGYIQGYARPLDQLSEKGDLLIAISSSGNSDNIIACTDLAKKKGMKIITLSGMSPDNRLWNCDSDVSYFVDSTLYGIVEVSHEALLHGVIETLWLKNQE